MKQEERLTFRYPNGKHNYLKYNNDGICDYKYQKAIDRLSEYEDTGLSPAEVEEQKHRADVAEEALKISCENCVECPYVIEDNNKYCKAGYGDGTEECDTSKAYLCWAEYYTQQAEQRLKEKQ